MAIHKALRVPPPARLKYSKEFKRIHLPVKQYIQY